MHAACLFLLFGKSDEMSVIDGFLLWERASSRMRYKLDAISDLLHLGERGAFEIQNILQIHTLL